MWKNASNNLYSYMCNYNFTFYDNKIVCHKIVRSINDKISEWYDHNFLTLLKVKEMNSISLLSPFLFFNQSISTLLHCIALV